MSDSKINLSFLQQFTGNDDAKMKKYISMFLASAPEAINTMRNQYNTKDWQNLKTTAHSLKPQLAYMGIDSVTDSILRIEEYAGEQKKPDEILQHIEHISETCNTAFQELENIIRST